MYSLIFIFLLSASVVTGQQGICDQTPPQSKEYPPSPNKGNYKLSLITKNSKNTYLPDQTYVLILKTNDLSRTFRWFMITADDPDADYSSYGHQPMEAGSLKTLDSSGQTRFSEACFNTVESADNSEKSRVEIHWLSPKQNSTKQRVRLRATVAENTEAWYTGEGLTILLEQDDMKYLDAHPYPANPTCNLCSEARYEVQFKGLWSRTLHPYLYPSKPDDNGYSHMVGASHVYGHTIWKKGDRASPGLQLLAEKADISLLEREIIDAMDETNGTRTLIRGARRRHPYMSEPSSSFFRADRFHHLFSIAVAMKPSPDWFLGVSNFELCTKDGWLDRWEIPSFPWDAGVMDGISYESIPVRTDPVDAVDRVEVGSFDKESPFYQMNLIDLKPFARIEVRKVAEYELKTGCDDTVEAEEEKAGNSENEQMDSETLEDPRTAESKQMYQNCVLSEWSEWSACVPEVGNCGIGSQMRSRYREDRKMYFDTYRAQKDPTVGYNNCEGSQDGTQLQSQHCYVDC